MALSVSMGNTFRVNYVDNTNVSTTRIIAAASNASNPVSGGALILAAIAVARQGLSLTQPAANQPENLRAISRVEIPTNAIPVGTQTA